MTGATPAVTAIVEDHPLFRDTIAAVVAAMPELDLGPVVATVNEALDCFADQPPDLALIDLSLGGMSGLDLVEEVGRRWPDVRCVVLSGHRRALYAEQTLSAGARGYILKGKPEDFRTGIHQVLAGGSFVSPSVRAAGSSAG